jgi:hypothetical protein
MKKILGLFLLVSMFASGAMAEKVDAQGRVCGSVKGIANCLSGCSENGVRLTPDKCGNSIQKSKKLPVGKSSKASHHE